MKRPWILWGSDRPLRTDRDRASFSWEIWGAFGSPEAARERAERHQATRGYRHYAFRIRHRETGEVIEL
jgi:hypothetical protein